MLMIQLAPEGAVKEFCAQGGVAYQPSLTACQAVENGRVAGFVLYKTEGERLTLLGADCPDMLLDGLVRAALYRGAAAGAKEYCFAAGMHGWGQQLAQLGYSASEQGQNSIDKLFSEGCASTKTTKN